MDGPLDGLARRKGLKECGEEKRWCAAFWFFRREIWNSTAEEDPKDPRTRLVSASDCRVSRRFAVVKPRIKIMPTTGTNPTMHRGQ